MEHIDVIYTLIRNYCLKSFPSRAWHDVEEIINSGLKIGLFGEEFKEWTTQAVLSGTDSYGSSIYQYYFIDNHNNADNIRDKPANYYVDYIKAMYDWLLSEKYISFTQPDGYLATEKMLLTNHIRVLQ